MPDIKAPTINVNSLLFGIIGIIVGLLLGFASVKLLPQQSSNMTSVVDDKKTEDNPLFTSQFAILNGKVLQIDENSITVQSGTETGKFALNKPIFISKPSTLAKPASPSNDIKIVPLNEFATLNLQKMEGVYKVTSISILPPVGTPVSIPSDFPLSSPPPAL